MLCTSLAILQLSGVKLPRELLWTSGYSDWSLSEKVSTRCRRLFHLTLLRSFKACKPPTTFFSFQPQNSCKKIFPNMHPYRETTSARFKNQHIWQKTHTADDVQVEHHYPTNVHGPKQQRSERQRWCQFCYKRQSFTTGRGKEKKKKKQPLSLSTKS